MPSKGNKNILRSSPSSYFSNTFTTRILYFSSSRSSFYLYVANCVICCLFHSSFRPLITKGTPSAVIPSMIIATCGSGCKTAKRWKSQRRVKLMQFAAVKLPSDRTKNPILKSARRLSFTRFKLLHHRAVFTFKQTPWNNFIAIPVQATIIHSRAISFQRFRTALNEIEHFVEIKGKLLINISEQRARATVN